MRLSARDANGSEQDAHERLADQRPPPAKTTADIAIAGIVPRTGVASTPKEDGEHEAGGSERDARADAGAVGGMVEQPPHRAIVADAPAPGRAEPWPLDAAPPAPAPNPYGWPISRLWVQVPRSKNGRSGGLAAPCAATSYISRGARQADGVELPKRAARARPARSAASA